MQEPLLADRPAAPPTTGPQSLIPSLRSITPRAVLLAAIAVGAVYRGGLLAWLMIVIAILIAAAAKRRIDIDGDAITVVPLLPLTRKRRIPWSSLGPFTQKRERGFTVLSAHQAGKRVGRFITFGSPDSFSVQAVYGHGWLGAPLSVDEFAALLEAYRSRANPGAPSA
jgi:hypothetical protein